ncbi:type II secretion system F family protein [Wenxinia marina]|uniref:Flp pilus assembly protein TadB n=1 Tax=Wenxinia marina DSM 24838 TaxID=1123501 RepID=A0A0D0QEI1_9RHOB|nr:type II secretion system F family protein [Wenxinia marina]KIQ69423.1 Flp pilus assembly protein TadB [Wenxinia marina DSM 24838]GGL58213.1 pilus assembly protein TadB [Wenxinia marina]
MGLDGLLNQPDAELMIYAGTALAVFLVITGISQLLSRRENRAEARTRRLKMIEKGASTEEILAVLKPTPRRSGIERLPFVGGVPRAMRQAGLAASPMRFLLLCATLAVVVASAAAAVLPWLAALIAGLNVGLFMPLMVLNAIRSRRLDRMTALLPDALDLMARGLRVGHPLSTSILAVAQEMPDPVGTEFGLIADQISYGDDLVDAFGEFAERLDLEDVNYLAASIAIQHGTGGDLAAIVDTLSKTIRARIILRRRVKAISAEGRLTGYFLTAVPFFIFGMNMIVNPDYYMGVRDDPLFTPMMVFIVLFVVLNGVVLNRLVKIRY